MLDILGSLTQGFSYSQSIAPCGYYFIKTPEVAVGAKLRPQP